MRIRQIVFAAHDLSASRQALATLLQLPAPFRDPGVAEFGIDNAVFNFGDQFIEVISPTGASTACGRHLERHGDSGYMLILQTDNLARERARFAALGVRTVWSTEYDDISAMHLHPKDVGAAIVSVDSKYGETNHALRSELAAGQADLSALREACFCAPRQRTATIRFGRTASAHPVHLG